MSEREKETRERVVPSQRSILSRTQLKAGLLGRTTQADWKMIFKFVAAAYPTMSVSRETSVAFWQVLRMYSPSRLKAAFEKHIRTNKWFPTIAEIVMLVELEPCPHPSFSPHERRCACDDWRCEKVWRGQKCDECGEEVL